MARKKRVVETESAEPPMSSMIDVVFLLLIYFIVTQKEIIPEAHLAVNMPGPESKKEQPENFEPPITIDVKILSGNEFQFRNKTVSLASLTKKLVSLGEADSEYTVMLKVSAGAKNYQLIQVLDACEKANLKDLNIVTLTY